jgi:hypothetical protein
MTGLVKVRSIDLSLAHRPTTARTQGRTTLSSPLMNILVWPSSFQLSRSHTSLLLLLHDDDEEDRHRFASSAMLFLSSIHPELRLRLLPSRSALSAERCPH